MSKHHKEEIECPHCHHKGEFDLWESVNVDLDPELREQVLNSRLFVWTCPKCESHVILPYDTLYHDMKHRFMLFFSYEFNEEEADKYAPMKMPKEFFMDGYTHRIVYGLKRLKEKILILEEGLNDVAVERMKFMISHIVVPEITEKGYELFFYQVDRTDEVSEYGAIFFVYHDQERDEEMVVRFAMDNYYEHCLAVELDPRMQVEGCMCVDPGWMAKQLLCAKENLLPDNRKGIKGMFKDGRWGLVDSDDCPLSEFKYWFVEDAHEGYFRAQVTGGSEYNLLRPNGSELLNQSFSYITEVHEGFFTFWRTKRKTKTTPTRYLHGVGHVSGVLLFPPLFERLSWLDEEKKEAYYAELDGKPYILTTDGSVYDPERQHLPKKLKIIPEKFFEKLANWVLPGLQFFYRDTDASVIVDTTYHVGDVLRAGRFVDVTTKLYKPAHKLRFIIASAHAAMLCEIDDLVRENPRIKDWNLCTLHYDSYFKVLDVYELDGVTQILLLHIPEAAARFLGDKPLDFILDGVGPDMNLIEMARKSLREKMCMEVHPRSLDPEFVERMSHPVGLDDDFYPVELPPDGDPVENEMLHLSNMIHKLANDADIEDFYEVDDNFYFHGVKEGTICHGCVFAAEINDKGEGCGCLAQEEFRKNYLKGRCDHRKASYSDLSDYERHEQEKLQKESLQAAKECNAYALALVKDFIADELEGDINRLKDYDFNRLRSEDASRQKAVDKYLTCAGGNMQGPDIAIVRAIASLVFGKAWEGFTLESMDNYKFKVDYLHQLVYLFGCPLGLEWGLKQFKGLDKFSPSEELRDRVVRFWNLHQTIGNIILLPTMLTQNLVEINQTRAKRLWRNYPDSFLKELREELVDETHRNKYLQSECYKNRKIYARCKTKDGFDRLMKELLLEDFLDENGLPVHRFAGVGSMDKGLDKETYLKAVDEYLDFCEKEIPLRAERIIDRLKDILDNN